MKRWKMSGLAALLALMLLTPGCGAGGDSGDARGAADTGEQAWTETEKAAGEAADGGQETEAFAVPLQKSSRGVPEISLENIPEFSGEPYVALNGNEPEFSPEDFAEESYETYSELDGLGRCGAAMANIGQDLMPTEERGSISQVKPSGWHSVQYDWVDGKNLYNRCHLIGYQLTAENANEKNLITGTRFLNVEGMLPFENMVADYIKETGNHVLYRVTPVFEGDNLVAGGVQMEGWSVEDDGEGICFNVYAYNNQPGVTIDYATGESWAEKENAAARAADGSEEEKGVSAQAEASGDTAAVNGTGSAAEAEAAQTADTSAAAEDAAGSSTKESNAAGEYILNTNTKKFHRPSCSSAEQIKDENRSDYSGDREDLISQGYEPCKNCNP